MKIVLLLTAAILSYLICSLNPAIILSKLIYKKDIREDGSKNPGFTNFKRVYGMKWAWLVFLLDISKALIMEIIFSYFFEKTFGEGFGKVGIAYSGFFAMLGHCLPLWYKFQGGKGFLVCISTLYMLSWKAGLFATLLLTVLLLATKYMSLATILSLVAGTISLPFIIKIHILAVILFALCTLFVIFRHKENIKRLAKGTESKFTFKKKKNPSENASESQKDNEEEKKESVSSNLNANNDYQNESDTDA